MRVVQTGGMLQHRRAETQLITRGNLLPGICRLIVGRKFSHLRIWGAKKRNVLTRCDGKAPGFLSKDLVQIQFSPNAPRVQCTFSAFSNTPSFISGMILSGSCTTHLSWKSWCRQGPPNRSPWLPFSLVKRGKKKKKKEFTLSQVGWVGMFFLDAQSVVRRCFVMGKCELRVVVTQHAPLLVHWTKQMPHNLCRCAGWSHGPHWGGKLVVWVWNIT